MDRTDASGPSAAARRGLRTPSATEGDARRRAPGPDTSLRPSPIGPTSRHAAAAHAPASDDALAFVHHALKEVEWIRKLSLRLRRGDRDPARFERDLECIADLSRSVSLEMRRFLEEIRGPAGGRGRIDPAPVAALVDDSVQRILLREPRPALRVHVDEGARNAPAPRQLVLALVAILENAIEFSDPEDPIRIDVHATGQWIRISVTDRGRGMDDDVLSACCARGFTTRPGRGGHGVGLYAAARIADRCGGSLRIRSRPGGGTRVTLRIARPEVG